VFGLATEIEYFASSTSDQESSVREPLGFHLLAKPTGAACNLDCKYCFFLSKDSLYGGGSTRMSDDVLEAYIEQLLAAQQSAEVNVAWQGGEPTLMGLDFFRRSMALVAKYRKPGQTILHTIQTNGILLDDEWARFFKQHGFLVGLSIDGPRVMHDAYRVTKGGRGTFDQVMRAWECLRRNQVDANILCTVNAANGDHGLEVYRFFRDEMRAQYLQSFRSSSARPMRLSIRPTLVGASGRAANGPCTSNREIW
jgi:uncharacterized protein